MPAPLTREELIAKIDDLERKLDAEQAAHIHTAHALVSILEGVSKDQVTL